MFSKDYEINTFNTDFTYHATPLFYLELVQDISGHSVTDLNLSIPKLQSLNKTWVVLRTRLEIDSYPYWRETLKVNTLNLKPNLFYFPRYIEILHNNKVACKASTLWTVIDTKTFRPQNPKDFPSYLDSCEENCKDYINKTRKTYGDITSYNLIESRSFKVTPGYGDITSYNLIESRSFKVTPGYGDINKHVNNLYYFDWVLKTLPSNLVTKYSICLLDISWIKQTFVNDEIKINLYEKKDDKFSFIFQITKDDTIMCQGELKFKEREKMVLPIKNKLLNPFI